MTDRLEIEEQATPRGRRYVAAMPDDSLARLNVVEAGSGRWIADSTFVPAPFRGRNVGERMAARLFADARAEGAKIHPTCWFIADELRRLSPEWDDVWAR